MDREPFTMDKIVGPNTFRNLAAITSKGLDEGFSLASASFEVHNERASKLLSKTEGSQCKERVTGDMTDLEFDFINFVCVEQKLLTDHGAGFCSLDRWRVNYRFYGSEKYSGVMGFCCNDVGEIGGPGFFYRSLISGH